MRTFYLIHDEIGNFIGCSQDKKMAKALIRQRAPIEHLTIKKLRENDEPPEIIQALNLSNYNINVLHSVYVFEHEEEDVKNAFHEAHAEMYREFDDFCGISHFIKTESEHETDVIEAFTNLLQNVLGEFENESHVFEDDLINVGLVDYTAIGMLKLQELSVKRKTPHV